MAPVDEEIAKAKQRAVKEQSWGSRVPRGFSIAVVAACAVAALAQGPSMPTPEPQLSTAERTAIQSLEKQKQDAQQSYQQALQAEMTISREFAMAHAGYHLDGQSFAVQKDAAAAETEVASTHAGEEVMVETAVNVPFEASEIIEIAVQEFRKRLQSLSPLQGGKEYTKFKIRFANDIFLWRMGEYEPKKTLAWADVEGGEVEPLLESTDVDLSCSDFESKDPNEERVARDMPLTIETSDGRGGKMRKKARVKG